ncbi:glycosyltransferase 87 family protein [Rhodobaculum claviforme]|uniref:DUF2029 domain-containing protein n=1 Tax=Rhodobaculum claviforme TaxID=1549854 RepID=A0A934WJI0_9RHOB|nr:glycosyltransferase 87 family protein [Rhodobaculum claviforme]MBK5927523.1 hypothetical protein [Rhodobaculum claviforme]
MKEHPNELRSTRLSENLLRGRTSLAAVAIILSLSTIYLIAKAVGSSGLDFRLIWLAGVVWSEGASPYGEAYGLQYIAEWGPGPITHFWVYPPWWWPISNLSALTEFSTATLSWAITGAGISLVSCLIIVLNLGQDRHYAFLAGGTATALVCVSQPLIWGISIGQTSFLLLGGIALLIHAEVRGSTFARISGLVLLMLKPSVGVFFLLFYLMIPEGRRSVTGALAALVVMTLPSLLFLGFSDVWGMAEALQRYGAPEMIFNSFANSTGLVQLASLLGVEASGALRTGIKMVAAGAALGLGLIATRRRDPVGCLAALCCLLMILLPLHSYDAVLIVPAVMYAVFRLRPGIPFLIAALLLVRPLNIAGWTGLVNPSSKVFIDSALIFFASALLSAMFLVMLQRKWSLAERTL